MSIRKTIAAGRNSGSIAVQGKYLEILDNSLTTNPHVSIDGGPRYEIPAGLGVRMMQPFNRIEFYNPAAESMSLWIGISSSDIVDSRTIITTSGGLGQLPVKDISYTINMLGEPDIALPTWDNIHVLPRAFAIDNAAAVNLGGGKVGIPVTSNPFWSKYTGIGQQCMIKGTINYDGYYDLVTGGGVNQVAITATYAAETFGGTEEIGLHPPKHIAANDARKELIVYNPNTTYPVFWGSSEIEWTGVIGSPKKGGIPIAPESVYIITCTDEVYFVAAAGIGKSGDYIQINELEAV